MIVFQEIVSNPLDVMCNCHGSHVLRSLLHLCKGVSLESSEFHSRKSSKVLAERLNIKAPRPNGDSGFHIGFPESLKLLVFGLLKGARKDVRILQVDQFGSLVIQVLFYEIYYYIVVSSFFFNFFIYVFKNFKLTKYSWLASMIIYIRQLDS